MANRINKEITEFRDFLIQTKSYSCFKENWNKYNRTKINFTESDFLKDISSTGAISFISCAFIWKVTKEGELYWRGE